MSSSAKTITATEASRNFSDLLNRVQYRGEEFHITRGKDVVATISPAPAKAKTLGDLMEAIKNGPRLDPGDADAWLKEIDELRKQTPLPPSPWD